MGAKKKPIRKFDATINCCAYQSLCMIPPYKNDKNQTIYSCKYCNTLFEQSENPIRIYKTDQISSYIHMAVKPRDIDLEKDYTPAMLNYIVIKASQTKAGLADSDDD